MSHELQSRLTTMRGAVQMLSDQRASLPSDEVTDLERRFLAQCQRLATVLDELLDIDRMGRGMLTTGRRPSELIALVKRVIARSTIADRVSLVAPDELTIATEPAQIGNVLDNLPANVAKYAPDGAVAVTVVHQHGRVRLAVLDQGPGIPADSLEEIFEPFRRLDDGRHCPGTGMGLALVAEFARLHGGRAWAEPEMGGAHLVVELPVAAA